MRKRNGSSVSQNEKRRRRRQALDKQYMTYCNRHGMRMDWESRHLFEVSRRAGMLDTTKRPGRLSWRKAARRGV